MRLEGLAHLSAIENALPFDFNASSWQFNETALVELNYVMFVLLAPATAILVVAMVIGVLGNLTVCFVFSFKMKASAQNNLLLSLGIFDLLSCCVGVPSEVYDMRHYFLYQSVAACKTLRFLTIVPTLASILVLLVIAGERYRKICYPLHQQFESSQVRLIVLGIVVISVFVSTPALFLYGHRSFPTGIPNLYGHDCSIDNAYKDGVIPLAYEALLTTAFAAATLILISLYLRILIETRRHTRYMKKHAVLGVSNWEEERTLSVNDPALLEQENDIRLAVSAEKSRRNSIGKVSLFSRLAREKYRLESKRNQRVISSDKTVDALATEKFTTNRCHQEAYEGDSREYEDVLQLEDQICAIGDEHADSKCPTESLKLQDENNHHHQNDTGNGKKYLSFTKTLPLTEATSPLTVTEFELGNSSSHTFDKPVLKANKPRTINRDISLTTQPLLHNSHEIELEIPNGKVVQHDKLCSQPFPSDSQCFSRTPKLVSQNENDYSKPRIIHFQARGKKVAMPNTDPKKTHAKKMKSNIMSLHAIRVRKAVSSRRATVIAFVITSSFIVSYLPHLILITLRSTINDFEHNLNETSLVLYNIFLRSYFANNVINVFVYGSMNMEFRLQLKKIFKNLRTCLCQK